MASTKGEEGGGGGDGERWVKKGRGLKVQCMEKVGIWGEN